MRQIESFLRPVPRPRDGVTVTAAVLADVRVKINPARFIWSGTLFAYAEVLKKRKGLRTCNGEGRSKRKIRKAI